MGEDEFVGVIVRIDWGREDAPIDEDLVEVVYVNGDEVGGLFDQEFVLLEEGDREFGANFGFAEGDFVGEVDRELHGLGSWVGGFAEFVDVGNDRFGD